MKLKCPHCDQQLDAPDNMAGRSVRCPSCEGTFAIPPAQTPAVEQPLTLEPVVAQPLAMQQMKDCPYCGEQIRAVAKKCKHCGEWLGPSARAGALSRPWPIKVVSTWKIPIFLVLTLNIYHVFWLYRVFKELYTRNATDVSPGKAVGFLFIPFFNFVWVFIVWSRLGRAISNAYQQAGIRPPATGIVWLVPATLIIAIALNLAALPAGTVVSIILISVTLCVLQGQMNGLAHAVE